MITPGSLWMSYGSRDIDLGDGDNSPADRATDFTIGASWNWGGPYGNVSYWRSYNDNRQLGSEGAGWQGDGLDLSLAAADDPPHGGITAQTVGVVHVVVATKTAKNGLAELPDHAMH